MTKTQDLYIVSTIEVIGRLEFDVLRDFIYVQNSTRLTSHFLSVQDVYSKSIDYLNFKLPKYHKIKKKIYYKLSQNIICYYSLSYYNIL